MDSLSPATGRDLLALSGALAIVVGVGLSFGLGAAFVIAGGLALGTAVAWSLLATGRNH